MTGAVWFLPAVVSLLVALVFAAGVGVPATRPSGLQGAIVRWGHAVVWLLLAAAFAAIGAGPPLDGLAAPLGLLALVIYLAFLASMASLRKR